jgi:hypothetical protein
VVSGWCKEILDSKLTFQGWGLGGGRRSWIQNLPSIHWGW